MNEYLTHASQIFYKNFDEFCMCILQEADNAILIDPWLDIVVDIIEYPAITNKANLLNLEENLEGEIYINNQLHCLSKPPSTPQEALLTPENQTPDEYQHYLEAFKNLTDMIQSRLNSKEITKKSHPLAFGLLQNHRLILGFLEDRQLLRTLPRNHLPSLNFIGKSNSNYSRYSQVKMIFPARPEIISANAFSKSV